MDQSPRLSLTYLAPQQAQKHVSVNETFRRLDALVHLRVGSRSVAVEPASPTDADAFILPAGKSGASWSTFAANAVAVFQDGAWAEIAPVDGLLGYVADEDSYYRYAEGNWGALSTGAAGNPAIFGVNTTADPINRLAVKSDVSLFNHDDVTPGTGDHRLIINKSASAKSASVVFQQGAVGHAEIGLTGDNNLHVRTSVDGAVWRDVFRVEPALRRVVIAGSDVPCLAFEAASNTDYPVLTFDDLTPAQTSIGSFNFRDNAGSTVGQLAYFFNKATPTNQYMRLFVNGAERVRITGDGSMVVGVPAGGAKGAGTINAQAVYDDNALLSCYVFDTALDGQADLAKWDAKAIGGRHPGARRFAGRIGGRHDPLTLDGYAAHWREKRHLSSLPSEAAFDPAADKLSTGEWIQRLVETVEIQAVLIERLNNRVKALEGASA